MILNELAPFLQAAFNNGDIEIKVICSSTETFESKLNKAMGESWSCVAIKVDDLGWTQGLLFRSTENKTEE